MSENGKGVVTSMAALREMIESKVIMQKFHSEERFVDWAREWLPCFDRAQDWGNTPDEMQAALNSACIAFPPSKPDDTTFWLTREALRFSYEVDGKQYRSPKWLTDVWRYRQDLRYHFIHISLDDETMVAYTPSPAYGMQDRQVKVRVGAYLKKFYGAHLSDEQIKAIVDRSRPGDVEILDHKQIVNVYMNGPDSCMSGGTDAFDENCDGHHPCECYQRPEWNIAVLMRGDDIAARALICTHDYPKDGRPDIKGRFVRCYGDDADSLHQKLMTMGYEHLHSWQSGATLKRIYVNGGYVLPYLDGGERRVSDEGGHMEIGYGDLDASNSMGWVTGEQLYECNNCCEEFTEDDMVEDYEGNRVCNNCIESSYHMTYTSARRRTTQGWVHRDSTIYCESTGDYYLDQTDVLNFHGIVQCLHSMEWVSTSDDAEQVRAHTGRRQNGWVVKDYAAPRTGGEFAFCYVYDIKLGWGVEVDVIPDPAQLYGTPTDELRKVPGIVAFIHPDDLDSMKDEEGNLVSNIMLLTDALAMELPLKQREAWTDECDCQMETLREELKNATDAARRAA